jgi:hypothetical protein
LKRKAPIDTANTTNNATTLASDQGYFVPAQESAKNRLVSDGMKMQLLTRSSSRSFSLKGRSFVAFADGAGKRKKIAASDAAPIG